MNNINIVGTIKDQVVVKETANGVPVGQMLVEVSRNKRGVDGETIIVGDVFQVTLWRNLIDQVSHLQPGTVVAIQGRLAANNYSRESGETYYRPEIVVEKLTNFA